MFDDMIKNRPDSYARTQCPKCDSYLITKYAMYVTFDKNYEQKAECNKCNNKWYIRYSNDLIKASTSPISVDEEMQAYMPYI